MNLRGIDGGGAASEKDSGARSAESEDCWESLGSAPGRSVLLAKRASATNSLGRSGSQRPAP